MKRNYIHLMLLPILLTVVITGCFSSNAKAVETSETGGIRILKTDIVGNPLEGAVFRVAREATMEELNDSAVEKALLKVDEKYITIVYETFLTDSPDQIEAVTGADGSIFIQGLCYGSYYLVETTAPQGYQRMKDPIRIRIHKYSHLTDKDGIRDDNGILIDNTLHIITIHHNVPETGQAEQITIYAASVAALFSLLSVLLLLYGRKR